MTQALHLVLNCSLYEINWKPVTGIKNDSCYVFLFTAWNNKPRHRTCAETAAILRGTSHVTTKQRCKYTTSVDIKKRAV